MKKFSPIYDGVPLPSIEPNTQQVMISINRYNELLEAEAILKALCRAISAESPYETKYYRAFAGKFWPEREVKKSES